ncbi:MAG: allantoinase AllB [Actinomycetes bacterium]|jgi:allantoinase|nr:MAG: allantoinase AllB [Actinomycetota bacterium]
MTTIRSTRVLVDGELRPATLRMEEGIVVEIGDGTADHDFGDLVVFPGLVDSHVHVNEPGRTEWEGFATATRAAIAGGTTTIVDMPLNSIPPTTDVAALEVKRQAASGAISCDVAFWGGFTGDTGPLAGLAAEGVSGFKVFLCESGVDEYPMVGPDLLGRAMAVTGPLGLPLLVHAEDPDHLRPVGGDPAVYANYLASRPVEAEVEAVASVAAMASATGAPAQILHVSSGDAAAVIGGGPDALTGETCPHYLTFCAEEIPDGATRFKCAPPIRERSQREALWDALREGLLQMVVSDHSPSPGEMKTGDFASSWGGISSVQLRLPAVWTGAAERGVPVERLADWLAAAPARLAGVDDRKGSIRVGADADLVVWDPDAAFAVDSTALHHRHPVCPYEGMTLRGVVVATLLAGVPVYSDGSVTPGRGRMLTR